MQKLDFSAVDDLASAHQRGRLTEPVSGEGFVPVEIGPLLELAVLGSDGRYGPLLLSPWLGVDGFKDFRSALTGKSSAWSSASKDLGFIRVVDEHSDDNGKIVRDAFLMAAMRAAQGAGFEKAVSQSFAAALREMESNIYEHSGRPASGLLAFSAIPGSFEFIAADAGIGVLATLTQAREFRLITDHGEALLTALQEGASRYGTGANRGMGFRDLFRGLSSLNADLRFRSGDHALTIAGAQPDLKQARLSQKALFQGFFAAVRCWTSAADATH